MAKGNGVKLTSEQKSDLAARIAETSARRVELMAELREIATAEEETATILGTVYGSVTLKDPAQGEAMKVRQRKGTGKDGVAPRFFFSRPWEKPAKDSDDSSDLDLLAD